MIADFSKKSLEELRILDLGVLEGAFSIELARRGATVVGIEGREANIVKAQFAKEALSLNNVDFILDDVRNVFRQCSEFYLHPLLSIQSSAADRLLFGL
jgi:2-polyprenyl-3-methyl-5-hydroxy-6-metoxy-1,4-benzoquinol methylase